MARNQRLLVTGVVVVLSGVVVAEHLAWRGVQRRYEAAAQHLQRMEREFASVLATHEGLKEELDSAKRHAEGLTHTLAEKSGELERVVGRLTEETKTAQQLEARLATLQQQLEQLQGELALALSAPQPGRQDGAGAVQLEGVVVGRADASAFEGRVISVHRDWNFVIVDLGWNQVKIGEAVSIFRNNQLLAKGRIDRVQERVSAVSVLQEWQDAEIQVNDLVRSL